MTKIPTVEEFLPEIDSVICDLEMLKDGEWQPDEHSCQASITILEEAKSKIVGLIKLHVKAALEAAAENADMDEAYYISLQEGSSGFIDKQSILNAYPDELIR